MDSALFEAFNTKSLLKFQSLFSKDLDRFRDNAGLLRYKTVFTNFATMFQQQPGLKRELVTGSLEVHPVKGKKKDSLWKITRVVSYDH